MSFIQYLAFRKPECDARGDFTRLAKLDPDFPDVETLDEVLTYTQRYRNALLSKAATEVWKLYQAMQRGRRSQSARAMKAKKSTAYVAE